MIEFYLSEGALNSLSDIATSETLDAVSMFEPRPSVSSLEFDDPCTDDDDDDDDGDGFDDDDGDDDDDGGDDDDGACGGCNGCGGCASCGY